MKEMPDDLGSAANFVHRIQHRLAHFHLFCSYVDSIKDWIVLLLNRSIVIRLQNNYNKKKTIPLGVLTESLDQPSAIQCYLAVFLQQLKQIHFITFHSFFREQKNCNTSFLLFILFIPECIPGH
jgi:hypothetical protein